MVADEREGWIERSAAEYERIMELSWKRIEDVAETWEKEKGRTFNPMLIGPMKGKKLT